MFSDHERLVLGLLGKRRMTIADLAKKFEGDFKNLDTQNYVASVIRRINKKCEFNGLDWMIKGEGVGRGGRTVWRDKVYD